jgi:anti-sigma factor RsiW
MKITIYKPADIELVVVDGDPPADQSSEVAALVAQRDALTTAQSTTAAERDALQARLDQLNRDIDAAQGQA